jgi:hypothetical protein
LRVSNSIVDDEVHEMLKEEEERTSLRITIGVSGEEKNGIQKLDAPS